MPERAPEPAVDLKSLRATNATAAPPDWRAQARATHDWRETASRAIRSIHHQRAMSAESGLVLTRDRDF